MKTCTKCKIEKEESAFHKNARLPDGLQTRCAECLKKNGIKYYSRHREEAIARSRDYYQRNKEIFRKKTGIYAKQHRARKNELANARNKRIKLIVLQEYGQSKCAFCGITDIRVLELDHIHGGGNKQRKETYLHSSHHLRSYLYVNGFPDKDKYRVLCKNCNWIAYLERIEQMEKNDENCCDTNPTE